MTKYSIMRVLLLYITGLVFSCFSTSAQSTLAGSWEGVLRVQGIELPLIVHLQHQKDVWTGTFDSPKQKAFGIQLSSVQVAENRLEFKVDQAQIHYEGVLREGDSVVGTFAQAGREAKMNLYRMKKGATPMKIEAKIRPQTPQPPFPYLNKTVKIKPKGQQHQLAGTLSMPAGKGPFPGVVLISGSGPQDRNSEVFEHQPFAVLADYLTRRGIAVLRYDDRGVAASTGSFEGATSADFAMDAAAALRFLQRQKGIRKDQIGYIGHSEGGMIAPLAHGIWPETKFAVLLAGVGIAVDSLLMEQIVAVGRSEGIEPAVLDSQLLVNRKIFGWLKSKSATEARDSLEAFFTQQSKIIGAEDEKAQKQLETQKSAALKTFFDPWFYYFIRYDPDAALHALQIPVLALNGDRDVQVLAGSNLAGMAASFAAAGNEAVTLKSLPGLNHLFQPSNTGAVSEYAEIDITFDEGCMQLIADWILGL